MHIFDKVFEDLVIDQYRSLIENHYRDMCKIHEDHTQYYPVRNIRLKLEDPIISKIKNFLESKLRVELNCYDCELVTWPVGIGSAAHNHDNCGRAVGDYNSLLYLNEDFDGGEFFTDTGITVKPKKGRLTFFNGKKITHGLNTVKTNHRYVIIFWWKKTVFK